MLQRKKNHQSDYEFAHIPTIFFTAHFLQQDWPAVDNYHALGEHMTLLSELFGLPDPRGSVVKVSLGNQCFFCFFHPITFFFFLLFFLKFFFFAASIFKVLSCRLD